ncbi:O-antigen ligase domain-containing protein [Egbenema bharatensis]|uniref:O-antigen ligase domain-containing protein n=1 Tax=Egbenema bharatensis TaxID=3463334 RepID=UPI003A83A1FB
MGFTFTGNPFPNVAITTPLVMFLWIPVVIYLFSRFPARKAVVISFLVAWLFLPQAVLELPGIPNYTKTSATCYGILLATIIYDVGRFSTFRFSLLDLPMAIWCLCPFVSSISNDLGAYDGVSATMNQVMTWGIPYFLGRIYINSLDGFRLLATGIFMGGLVYIPFCLIENRFSPQLHRIVYGDHAFLDFGQSIRLGGFRPTVFMHHGLAVGAFMMVATLSGIWLWRAGTLKRLWDIPVKWLVWALFITFILVRSTGAYGLLAFGVGIMIVGRRFRSALPIFLLILGIFAYLYVNTFTESYVTDQILDNLGGVFPEDRLQSLEFRFFNEELLAQRAQQRFWFGWGGFGRALVQIDPLNPWSGITVQDSLWIIAFGHHGIVGLTSLFVSMLLPVIVLFWSRYPARQWFNPQVAPAIVLAVGVVLYMVDCILNAMINPLYILAVGGIAGLVLKPKEKLRKAKPRMVMVEQEAYPAIKSSGYRGL